MYAALDRSPLKLLHGTLLFLVLASRGAVATELLSPQPSPLRPGELHMSPADAAAPALLPPPPVAARALAIGPPDFAPPHLTSHVGTAAPVAGPAAGSSVVPIGVVAPPTGVQQVAAHESAVVGTQATQRPELSRAEIEQIVREYLDERAATMVPASATEQLTPTAGAEAIADPSNEGTVVGSELDFKAKWNHGLEFETPAKDFRIHVGGRTQVDAAWFETDTAVENGEGGLGNIPDSVNFRRARLRVDGLFWEVVEFAAEYDFVNQFNADPLVPPAPNTVAPIPAMTDLWLTITQLPVIGNFRIGNMKDPLSMEHITSSRFLPFLERSYQFDGIVGTFNNGFAPGMMAFNWSEDERMTWAAGVFKNVTNPFGFGIGGGEYNLEGRLTALPYYEAEGRYLVHVGGSASQRDLDNEQQRYRARGSIRNGPPGPLNAILADTGIMYGDDQQILNGELAGVWGPLMVQSEYIATWVQDAQWPSSAPVDQGTAFFQGTYVQALWFLTGEHQAYNRKMGVFDRVVPNESFFLVPGCGRWLCGSGAWQIGARYSFLDLNSSGIQGGMLHGMTIGLNWFLNPNAKLQWNYDYTYRSSASGYSDGDIQALGMRMAMDF